ncbi:hypothetical protein WICMUC_004285 [Wickerhamomyces mucosus]|uniref:Uncharacterized protein n=1 Tax=Wickerhamomyces mucosus TaxID=1378264 RepID=A0A9P8PJ92_9ASCO|nr:hypothetical protein WICMUC_004285 [Wickerhamomyces mucosus]
MSSLIRLLILISTFSLGIVALSSTMMVCDYVDPSNQLSINFMVFPEESVKVLFYKYSDIISGNFPYYIFEPTKLGVVCKENNDDSNEEPQCLVQYETGAVKLSPEKYKIIETKDLNSIYNIEDSGFYCAKLLYKTKPRPIITLTDSGKAYKSFHVKQMIIPYLLTPLALLVAIHKHSIIGKDLVIRMSLLAVLSSIYTLLVPLTSNSNGDGWTFFFAILYSTLDSVIIFCILQYCFRHLQDLEVGFRVSTAFCFILKFHVIAISIGGKISRRFSTFILGVFQEDIAAFIVLFGFSFALIASLALYYGLFKQESHRLQKSAFYTILLFILSPFIYLTVWILLKLYLSTYNYSEILDNFESPLIVKLLIWWDHGYYGLLLTLWIWISLKYADDDTDKGNSSSQSDGNYENLPSYEFSELNNTKDP